MQLFVITNHFDFAKNRPHKCILVEYCNSIRQCYSSCLCVYDMGRINSMLLDKLSAGIWNVYSERYTLLLLGISQVLTIFMLMIFPEISSIQLNENSK